MPEVLAEQQEPGSRVRGAVPDSSQGPVTEGKRGAILSAR